MNQDLRDYRVCSKTVMDTSDPNIKFDENGICDHVHDFYKYVKPRWHTDDLGYSLLLKQIDKIKKEGRGKDYDCILGVSGGIDSSYMLHLAVNEFKLRPLVFHVDGGWNSELAVHNINVMINKLNLDLYTEVINWEEMRDFQLAFFKTGTPHLDIPQDHAFVATLYNYAYKYNIKYILNGGNISTECVQYPLKYYYYGTDMAFINDVISRFCTIELKTYPFSSVLRHKVYLKYIRGINVVKPLDFIPYLKQEASKILEQEYGWRPYPQKHFESRFTKFFESYWLPERFGFDPRRVMFSSLILTNQIDREEALEILKKPAYNVDQINDDIKYISNKLEITEEELDKYFTMPKNFYWNYKNQQNVFKVGAHLLNVLGIEKVKKRNQ